MDDENELLNDVVGADEFEEIFGEAAANVSNDSSDDQDCADCD